MRRPRVEARALIENAITGASALVPGIAECAIAYTIRALYTLAFIRSTQHKPEMTLRSTPGAPTSSHSYLVAFLLRARIEVRLSH